MPQIPIQTPTINENVPGMPGGGPHASVAIEQAVSNLGQQVVGTALDFNDEIKKSEAINAVSEASNQERLDSEKYLNELKIKSPDGYVRDPLTKEVVTNPDNTQRTISQEYRDWANSRYKQTQSKMPTRMAQDLYKSQSAPYFSSQISAASADEKVLQIESNKVSMQRRFQSGADNLVSFAGANPSKGLQMAYDLSNTTKMEGQAQVGILHSQPVFDEMTIKNDNQIFESYGHSLVNEVNSIPRKGRPSFDRKALAQQGIAILTEDRNKPSTLSPESRRRVALGLPILSEMGDPDKKASILAQLKSVQEKSVTQDKSELKLLISNVNATSDLRHPERVNYDAVKSQILRGMNTTDENGKAVIGPYEGSIDIGSLTLHQEMSKVVKDTAFMSDLELDKVGPERQKAGYTEAQKYLASVPGVSTAIGGTLEKTAKEEWDTHVKKIKDERIKDYKAYADENTDLGKTVKATMQQRGANFANPTTLTGMGPMLQHQIEAYDNLYAQALPNTPQYNRAISKPDSEAMSNFFKDNTKPIEMRARALITLSQELGPHFTRVMHDMIDTDKNLKDPWYFASVFTGSQVQTEEMISSLTTDLESTENKAYLAKKGLTMNDVHMATQNAFSDFLSGAIQQGPNDPFYSMKRSAMLHAAEVKALDLMKNGRADSFPDAAVKAKEDFIGQSWHVKQVDIPGTGTFGFFGDNYKMIIPKVIKGATITETQANQLVSLSQDIMSKKGMQDWGAVGPKDRNGKPTEFTDEYYAQIAKTGRAVINQKTGALEVWWWDKYSNTDRSVTNAKGEHLSIPFTQMLKLSNGKNTSKVNPYVPGK